MKQQQFGLWQSPIDANKICGSVNRFVDLCIDGPDIYWVEMRPAEEGRFVIMKQTPNQKPHDILPPEFTARTRVHEYGGAAFTVKNSVVYFSNDLRGLYKIEPKQKPVSLNTPDKIRFADLQVTTSGIIAIAESHQAGGQPKNYIASVDPKTGQVQIIEQGEDFYSSIAIRADGKKIAWISWNHPHMPWTNTKLWMGDLTANGIENKTRIDASFEDQAFFQPMWSPQGELIVSTDKQEWWNLYRVNADQTLTRLFAIDSEIGEPLWKMGASQYAFLGDSIVYPRKQNNKTYLHKWANGSDELMLELDYSTITHLRINDEVIACFASSPIAPSAVLRIQSSHIEVVHQNSNLNFDRGYLTEPQAITFNSADGRKAHAFYYPPKNKDYQGTVGTKPALIVMSHGGPTGNCGSAFDPLKQFYTSRGYAIVDVNYGGSTGYGRSYRNALNGKWGIVDVQDCEAAAQYLVDQGLVDPNKLAITGGSAGGYTTLAALTFGTTFKAGSSHYGVSDLVALAEDTHKFEARYLDGLVAPYPEGKQVYIDRSPINHVQNLNCPVIFFQGQEDAIVLPNQAIDMHEALKARGIMTELFLFEGEQHGFRIQKNKITALENELRFFNLVFNLA